MIIGRRQLLANAAIAASPPSKASIATAALAQEVLMTPRCVDRTPSDDGGNESGEGDQATSARR